MIHEPPASENIGDLLLRVMLDLIKRQPDPVERAAMLDILKKDGWLK